jgi:peptide deformylase
MRLPLVTAPHPVLSVPARPVMAADWGIIPGLVADMVETMYAEKGIGLAAPQVGVGLAVAVIDLQVRGKPARHPYVLVNPVLTARHGERAGEEGCLSVPGAVFVLTRADRIEVSALDERGRPWRLRASGLLATCLQHELAHLAGHLVSDEGKRVGTGA